MFAVTSAPQFIRDHCRRISARLLGILILVHLELLATLHDIGKVGIAENILNKQGKLDEDEWIEMRKHPEIGYRIAMSSPSLAPIAEYILHHHERSTTISKQKRNHGRRILI